MPLLDRTGWKADAWTRGEADAAAAIVPFAELEAALAARRPGQRLGIDLANDVHPRALDPFLAKLDLIAIAFPRYSDGRGFSLARILRQRGFSGLLRATGHVLPDQFGFALHVGFDEVEIDETQAAREPIEQWLAVPGFYGESYQDTADGEVSIFKRRRAAAAAE